MKRACLVVVLLAGCAQPKVWYQPGISPQQFEMDKGQCQAQAFGSPTMNSLQIAIVFNSCMRGKGWYLVDQ